MASVPAEIVSYRDAGLAPATTYQYRLRICGDGGCSGYTTASVRTLSTELEIWTAVLPPALVDAPFDVSMSASQVVSGELTWKLVDGGLPPGVSLSEGGLVSGSPSRAGVFTFTVSASSGGRTAERDFTLRVLAEDGGRFDITPFEVVSVPPAIRSHLEAAVTRWERIISGDVASARIPPGFLRTTDCAGFGPLVNGTSLDDVIVIVDISPIDGAGKILGQAGPCGLRNSLLPFVGVLMLDSSDLTTLVGSQTLTDLFFHEIGHILGFGALWGPADLLSGLGGWDPRFIGALAMDQLRELGGKGGVPIENLGPPGTAWVHWRESTFTTEIMTGYAEHVGTEMPISRVTIASMADLGYAVDVNEADEYELPALPVPPSARAAPLGFDILLPGPPRVLPDEGAPRSTPGRR